MHTFRLYYLNPSVIYVVATQMDADMVQLGSGG